MGRTMQNKVDELAEADAAVNDFPYPEGFDREAWNYAYAIGRVASLDPRYGMPGFDELIERHDNALAAVQAMSPEEYASEEAASDCFAKWQAERLGRHFQKAK